MKKLYLLLLLMWFICNNCFLAIADDKCNWIRPVSVQYIEKHDIGDSCAITLVWTGRVAINIKRISDTRWVSFDEEFYSQNQDIPHDFIILPAGNYIFSFKGKEELEGNIEINSKLRPGSYYRVLVQRATTRESYKPGYVNVTYSVNIVEGSKDQTIKYFRSEGNFLKKLIIGISAVFLVMIYALFFTE